MEQSSCTEDRIQHVLERCLCNLGLNTPDKQLWNAGLCINRWCLEELVKRDGHNFLILLQKVLKKTKEVLEQCRYELVVPLTLLFSSTLLKAPPVSPDCGVLQEAYLLFHSFLAWPEPCCSASKRLLNIIQQELRAPGISFQRLVRAEQSVSPQIHHSKTIMVLLVSPDDDVPPEVQSVAEQLSSTGHSNRDVTITLILHGFQAALGTRDLQALHTALQTKRPDELEQLMKVVTDSMETAASATDLSTARQGLIHSMERLRESLAAPVPANGSDTWAVETFMLPFPNCRTCSWENDNFDFLNHILDSDLDSPEECFLKGEIEEEDINDTSVDEEDEVEGSKADRDFQNHRISTASSSSRDSTFSSYSLSSSWSVSTPSGSSGIESDFSEDTTHEDTEEGQDSQPKPRKKPKKKSRSILGVERFSLLFKNPRSPNVCRRVQSMGHRADFTKDYQKNGSQLKHSLCRQMHPLRAPTAALDPLSPQKHMCVRRRPILSCDEGDVAEVPTLVKVVVFGGDKEAGRLARAYSDLQQKESKCPRLTRMCKLQFYFVPTKRRTTGSPGQTPTEGQIGGSSKAAASVESNDSVLEDNTTDIAQMLGMLDPWYERNVLNMLSLSSDVLCQTACKDGDVSVAVSGRSQWMQTEIVCTSINLYKACRKPEQLDSRVESLRLMMTEVLKRQCSKSKKGYNQHISISEVKVDKVQVSSGEDGTTFAVCLDQDEKKFIQSVTRCEVSLCCKPGSSSDWKSYKPLPGQVQPLHPSYCSLLCLPITSFTASSYSKLWINAENMDEHPALSASSMCDDVQALLKEMNSHSASQKGSYDSTARLAESEGKLRWILQKKLESDPSCSILLIQVLVKELKKKLKTKTCKTQSYVRVIPVLHTIYYVVIQSGGMIPASLYQTVYECLIKLLILPTPYCTVVLSTLRSIKMEMITPGSLYQRRVVAEQNLKSEHFTVQEKVFVLADPAVFSAPLEATVRAHFEAPSSFKNTSTMERNVVLHVLQTGLGATCQSSRLAQALEVLEDHVVEKYFQEVVPTVEQSIKHGAGGCAIYLNKLHDIYRNILTDCREEITKVDHGSLAYGAALPFPEINFQLWRSKEDLWNLLVKFALDCCRNSCTDEEVKDKKGSVQSEFDQKERNPTSAFSRRKAFKNMKPADKITLIREKIEAFPGSSPAFKEDRRRHTARVVVMGDDRVLGTLTRAYCLIRERESKRLVLTKRLDIRFYYIPVTDVEPSSIPPSRPCQDEDRLSLASLLGRVDPWYNSNINSLGAEISKLSRTHSEPSEQNLFLLDSLCYYLRCGKQPVNIPLYSVKMTCSSGDVDEVFVSHLEAEIPEFKHLKENSPSQDYLSVRFDSVNPKYNTKIQTQNISIRTMEHRTLSVRLDKDSRRRYTDVQRIEISPCLDPGCSVWSRFSVSGKQEQSLSKFLNTVLSLPINTFTGVTL
ncbi:Phosphoinositide 3-kinase regulatory subunit 5 [Collichthys lucidus]|uniref:Phosphoinositide 3-kinase regulatory subunit 5 n=1 Tax=Collichthys lucidus TaxID=240159 RepID=A0A4V6AVZ5_COLLU|nr:Phosphoinositide 3-kinase regulatory subunit 5 [Collichthys lucidus]